MGLDSFLSPVRLPVSPPGRVENASTYCITSFAAGSTVVGTVVGTVSDLKVLLVKFLPRKIQ